MVATLSLSSHTVLVLRPIDHKSTDCIRILQEPRSMLITSKAMYTTYRHEIEETFEDSGLDVAHIANFDKLGNPDAFSHEPVFRELRISLTYRQVLKVIKGLKLGR